MDLRHKTSPSFYPHPRWLNFESAPTAAKLIGITQPKVSDMMRGDFSNLSERKLMDCLTRLGYDIEIKVRPAKSEVGHLRLAPA